MRLSDTKGFVKETFFSIFLNQSELYVKLSTLFEVCCFPDLNGFQIKYIICFSTNSETIPVDKLVNYMNDHQVSLPQPNLA